MLDTGAAYHQFRSQALHPEATVVGSNALPSPTILPVTRCTPCAMIESASRSIWVNVESQAPGASVSTPKHRADHVGPPRPYKIRSPRRMPPSSAPFTYTLRRTRYSPGTTPAPLPP